MTRLSFAVLGVACAMVVATAANSDIVQVFDPGDLIGGPFTVEDFEDDIFEPGATYSASSGIQRVPADVASDGVTPSGLWGLSTNSFPNPITVTFDEPASSVGMWFGNDDTCCTPGFFANLDIFGPGGFIGTISVEANMNDWADQFIGFNSNEMVTSVTIRYGTGADVGLFHYIDDVYFASAPPLGDCSAFPCGNNNNKVLLCHVPPGNPANAHTLCISAKAVAAHLESHPGDHCGPCGDGGPLFQADVVQPCPDDVNGDGTVNTLDLIDVLLCLGQPGIPGCEAKDVNEDGNVNVLDLIDLLLAFGTACP